MRSPKRNRLLEEAAADPLNTFEDLWLVKLGRKTKNKAKKKKKKTPVKKKKED